MESETPPPSDMGPNNSEDEIQELLNELRRNVSLELFQTTEQLITDYKKHPEERSNLIKHLEALLEFRSEGSGAPGAGSGAPGAWSGAPGAGSGAPGAWSGAPGAWSGAPGAGSGAPGAGSGAPGAGSGAPGAGSGGPGAGSGGPGAGSGGPGEDTSEGSGQSGKHGQSSSKRLKVHTIVVSETYGAHKVIIQKIKKKHLEVKNVTAEECDVVLLFCVANTRVASDVQNAISKIPGAASEKPVVLVVMHHQSKDLQADGPQWSSKYKNVKFQVDMVFHQSKNGFFKCDTNYKAINKLCETFSKFRNDGDSLNTAV